MLSVVVHHVGIKYEIERNTSRRNVQVIHDEIVCRCHKNTQKFQIMNLKMTKNFT